MTALRVSAGHVVLLGLLGLGLARVGESQELLRDSFDYPDGLVTNEWAFWNRDDPRGARVANWELDSGSLFARYGKGWTGIPDSRAPDPKSSSGNHSAVFRLDTRRSDFGDVEVSFELLDHGLSSTAATPAVAWDGVHVWLRYQSEYQLYYASINRRDDTSVIKKKVPGGASNGGTYYELGPAVAHKVPYGSWRTIRASVRNLSDGSVAIALYENDRLIVSAIDDGSVGGAPLRNPGRVGIRGDNAQLEFDDFRVVALPAQGTSSP